MGMGSTTLDAGVEDPPYLLYIPNRRNRPTKHTYQTAPQGGKRYRTPFHSPGNESAPPLIYLDVEVNRHVSRPRFGLCLRPRHGRHA